MKKILLFSLLSFAIPAIAMQPGTDVNSSDQFGRTPLMNAVYYYPTKGKIEALLDAGANINAQDILGRTAIWIAAWRAKLDPKYNLRNDEDEYMDAENSYSGDVYDLLLAHRANPNIQSTQGDFRGKSAKEIHEANKEDLEQASDLTKDVSAFEPSHSGLIHKL